MASSPAGAALAAACLLASCSQNRELAQFEAHLSAHDSATEALQLWCGQRGIAKVPEVRAEPASGHQPPPADLRKTLSIGAFEPTGYRHVRLSCGVTVLSEAHNWFVPARLAPEMNRRLAESDTPFGKVAAPLHFTRQPLSTRRGRGEVCPAGTISTHRALLRLPDGQPLALVVECYTSANLRS